MLSKAGTALVAIAALVGERQVAEAAVADDAESTAQQQARQRGVDMGSRLCPLDISVLWTADVDSPVYSAPVILPSSVGDRKQVNCYKKKVQGVLAGAQIAHRSLSSVGGTIHHILSSSNPTLCHTGCSLTVLSVVVIVR